jgi:hypothetical protein
VPTIEQKPDATILIVDSQNIDTAFQDAKFRALLEDGYRIVQVMGVEEGQRAGLMFVFERAGSPQSSDELNTITTHTKIALWLLTGILVLLSTITINVFGGI